jgi:hypothetical protein
MTLCAASLVHSFQYQYQVEETMALGAASLAHVIVLDLQTDNKICMTG